MVVMMIMVVMTGGDVEAHIDITGRLEDGWRFPFNEAVVVKGRLGHRCDVVVPVSAAHTIHYFGGKFGILMVVDLITQKINLDQH